MVFNFLSFLFLSFFLSFHLTFQKSLFSIVCSSSTIVNIFSVLCVSLPQLTACCLREVVVVVVGARGRTCVALRCVAMPSAFARFWMGGLAWYGAGAGVAWRSEVW